MIRFVFRGRYGSLPDCFLCGWCHRCFLLLGWRYWLAHRVGTRRTVMRHLSLNERAIRNFVEPPLNRRSSHGEPWVGIPHEGRIRYAGLPFIRFHCTTTSNEIAHAVAGWLLRTIVAVAFFALIGTLAVVQWVMERWKLLAALAFLAIAWGIGRWALG
jgi:hypothetical protein